MYNGKEVQTVKLDGVVVWQRYVPIEAGSITTSKNNKVIVPKGVKVLACGWTYQPSEGKPDYTHYIKVTEGKSYEYKGEHYFLHVGGNGGAEQEGGVFRKIGAYLIEDSRRGGSIARVAFQSTTFYYSEEINKHATNGSAD